MTAARIEKLREALEDIATPWAKNGLDEDDRVSIASDALAAYDAAKEEEICFVNADTTSPRASVANAAPSAPPPSLRERLHESLMSIREQTVAHQAARLTLARVEEELRVQILDAVTLARMITVLAAVRKELA